MISNTTVVTVIVASVDLYQFDQGKGGTNTRPQFSTALLSFFFLSLWYFFFFDIFSILRSRLLSSSCPPPLSKSTSLPFFSKQSLSLRSLQGQHAVGNSCHRHCLNQIFFSTFSPPLPSLFSHSHSAFSFSMSLHRPHFSWQSGTVCAIFQWLLHSRIKTKKNKIKRCVMIVLLLYLQNDKAI